MKAVIVNFKDLDDECWSAKKFTGECQSCYKSKTCNYKSKNIRPEVQADMNRIEELKAQKKKIDAEMQRLRKKNNISPPSESLNR